MTDKQIEEIVLLLDKNIHSPNKAETFRNSIYTKAAQIYQLFAGYKSPVEVEQIVQGWKDAYAFPEKWAKANGYVKQEVTQEIKDVFGHA